MSERLIRFLLSELKVVRLRCKGCGVVTELPPDDMGKVAACPACRADWRQPSSNSGVFLDLANAIRDALGKSKLADVEFVLPDPSSQP